VTGKPHRIAVVVCRYGRKRTGGLGAEPDTAIYLEPLGNYPAALIFGECHKPEHNTANAEFEDRVSLKATWRDHLAAAQQTPLFR
jgi:hypothetical protein